MIFYETTVIIVGVGSGVIWTSNIEVSPPNSLCNFSGKIPKSEIPTTELHHSSRNQSKMFLLPLGAWSQWVFGLGVAISKLVPSPAFLLE